MSKVFVEGGHSLTTPGKRTPDGEREWSFNNKVVLAFIAEMNTYQNVQVRRGDDPSGKVDVPLKTRTDEANAWGADVYVSIHHNANTGKWGTWTGTETFHYPGSTKSAALAKAVHPKLVAAFGLKDRGIKTQNFHVLRETKMPAILTEGGYMDSSEDIKALRSDARLKAQGKAIAQGVAAYLGLKKKEVAPVATKPTTPTSTKSEVFPEFKSAQDFVIAKGISNGENPRANVTRQQVWAMMERMYDAVKAGK